MDDLTNTPDADSSSRAADALRDQQQRWIQPLLEQLDQAESARAWADVERLCKQILQRDGDNWSCLLYTSPSPRDLSTSRMPSSA